MTNLKQLLGLCEHKWVTKENSDIKRFGEVVGWMFLLVCEKCGDLKQVKVK